MLFGCNDINSNSSEIHIFYSVYPEGSGEIVTNFDEPVQKGDTVSLSARSLGRYQFSHWFVSDTSYIEKEIDFIVENDLQLVAHFKNAPLIYGVAENLVVDITDPLLPIEYTVNFPHDLSIKAINYRYVYAAEHFPSRLYCYDFQDIQNPVIIDSIILENFPGNYIPMNDEQYLVVLNKYSIELVDITSPFSAQTYGALTPVYQEQYSSVLTNKIIIQSSRRKLIVRDITDPVNPTYEEIAYDWMESGFIEFYENKLYTISSDTLIICDASDLANLTRVGAIPLTEEYYNWNFFTVKNEMLFQYNEGVIYLHDISDLSDIQSFSILELPQDCGRVTNILFYFDNMIVVSYNAIFIYDIENVYNPNFINSIQSGESMEHFQLLGERLGN